MITGWLADNEFVALALGFDRRDWTCGGSEPETVSANKTLVTRSSNV